MNYAVYDFGIQKKIFLGFHGYAAEVVHESYRTTQTTGPGQTTTLSVTYPNLYVGEVVLVSLFYISFCLTCFKRTFCSF